MRLKRYFRISAVFTWVLLIYGGVSDAATITARTCSAPDVQAAIDMATTGDLVVIPNGLCTWSAGVRVSGKGLILQGQSKAGVVIVNNVTSGNAISITEDPTFHSRLSHLTIQANTSAHAINVLPADRGQAVLIHDLVIKNGHGIKIQSNRGVIFANTYTVSKAVWQFVMCAPTALTSSWTTNGTMGTADTNGESNVYVEDNVITGAVSQALDMSDNCRIVVRFNKFDNSGLSSHGPDTGAHGLRHFEIYNNIFTFTNYGDCDGTKTAAVDYQIFLRGGTGVITDNTFDSLSSCSWGNKPSLSFTVMMPWRNAGPHACWSRGWPVPHQIGQGYRNGPTVEPVYVWNNSGSGRETPSFVQYSPNECGGTGATQTIGSYLQLLRDVVVGTPKPGYTKSPYPHTLRGGGANTTSAPAPPMNVRIIG